MSVETHHSSFGPEWTLSQTRAVPQKAQWEQSWAGKWASSHPCSCEGHSPRVILIKLVWAQT